MRDKPVWLQPGPAENYYQRYINEKPLRQTWVEMIRSRWGNPIHPGLSLFPEVQQTTFVVPATIDVAVPVVQFTPPDSPDNQDIFIYIHGGGWVIPASGKHLAWAKKIAHLSAMTVLSVDYRLIPEHPFPTALHDCITVYQYARTQTSGRVLVGGDSAGGNLAAALALYCADQTIQRPDKVLCLSSFSDFHFENYPSMLKLGIGNPYIDMSVIAFIRAMYVPETADWTNPYVSPIFGKLTCLPPTCVVVGLDDPLRDDNLLFAQKLQEAQVDVTLLTFEGMPHSFFTYPDVLPEPAEKANQAIVQFMRQKPKLGYEI